MTRDSRATSPGNSDAASLSTTVSRSSSRSNMRSHRTTRVRQVRTLDGRAAPGQHACVPPSNECDVERLSEFDAEAVADLNALIPQLKPDWRELTATQLETLIASESRVYVARCDGRIVGLTVMVPHRHLPGLR